MSLLSYDAIASDESLQRLLDNFLLQQRLPKAVNVPSSPTITRADFFNQMYLVTGKTGIIASNVLVDGRVLLNRTKLISCSSPRLRVDMLIVQRLMLSLFSVVLYLKYIY